jgi:hypothetical protein
MNGCSKALTMSKAFDSHPAPRMMDFPPFSNSSANMVSARSRMRLWRSEAVTASSEPER